MIETARRWTEVSLTLPAEFQEAVVDYLIGLGATGVLQGESTSEKPLLKTYFREDEPVALLRGYLREIGLSRRCRLSTRSLPDEEWTKCWQPHSVALRPIGRRLLVRAPWHIVPLKWRKRNVVTIEPAMAFGTGTHVTTRHCLEFIEKTSSGRSKPKTFLDLGCGSAILAIAAFKLGVGRVTAVDNDPVALNAARKNARINHVRGIRFRDRIPTGAFFDLVVANIISGTLISLNDRLTRAVRPGGRLILSGILKNQTAEVLEAYEKFEMIKSRTTGEWTSLLLKKRTV